jgi:hypothetical protein
MTDPGHAASVWTDRSFLPYPEPLVEAVVGRLKAARGAVFRVTTHSGCLICA